jgi:periplasmic divalent cation tolerance protein
MVNLTDPPLIVMVTTPTEEEARSIGWILVESRLAAGVNFTPINSIYRWEGQIHDSPEYQLWIQTKTSQYPALENKIKELHSYEVPQIIALSIASGYEPYLSWIKTETD